jgi:hypothetical protein
MADDAQTDHGGEDASGCRGCCLWRLLRCCFLKRPGFTPMVSLEEAEHGETFNMADSDAEFEIPPPTTPPPHKDVGLSPVPAPPAHNIRKDVGLSPVPPAPAHNIRKDVPPSPVPAPPAHNIRFPIDPSKGIVHTCVLVVIACAKPNLQDVPVRIERMKQVERTFGTMVFHEHPVHIPQRGETVFLGICGGGAAVMDAWMSDKGRQVINDHVSPLYTLSYMVSCKWASTTYEAWTTYCARFNNDGETLSSSSSDKYAIQEK